MKVASITETKNRLSALLDLVRRGETVLIVDRGRPIARLEPVVMDAPESVQGRLARLERQGIVKRGSQPVDPRALASKAPHPRDDAGVVQALLEERQQGR